MTRTKSTFLALIAVLLSPMAANADLIYAPGGSDVTEGNTNNCIPVSGCLDYERYQQVYDSSLFSSISGPMSISAIAFRIDGGSASASGSYSDLRISLSTTSASSTAVSTTFADNYGGDLTTVFDDAFTWSATGGSSPNAFDLVINLTTAFIYDPLAGNLLFEWQNFGGESTSLFFLDAASGVPMSRVYGTDASGPNGFSDNNYGLVTQFTATAVPEPGTLALLGIGLLGMGAARRKTKV